MLTTPEYERSVALHDLITSDLSIYHIVLQIENIYATVVERIPVFAVHKIECAHCASPATLCEKCAKGCVECGKTPTRCVLHAKSLNRETSNA